MKAISIQVTFRRGRPFAAYIYLDREPGQRVIRTEQVSEALVVDFGPDDRAIGIEVVSPDVVRLEEILEVFDRLGLPRPELSELRPLQAA
jgi:uncharacterized protein YuzE